MRQLLRRAAIALAAVLGLLVVGLWIASRTGVVQNIVRARLLDVLREHLDAEVTLGRVDGMLGHSLHLLDLRIALEGRTVVRVPRIDVVYAPLGLLRGHLQLRSLRLIEPEIRAVRDGDRWQLPAWIERTPSFVRVIEIRHLEVVDGRVVVALLDGTSRRLGATGIQLAAGVLLEAARREVRVASLHLTPRGMALSPLEGTAHVVAADALRVPELRLATARSALQATGHVAPGDDVSASVSLALDPGELRAIVPTSRIVGGVRATLEVTGPWQAATVAATAAFDAGGTANVTGRVALAARPVRYALGTGFADLDPGAIVEGLWRGRLSGRGRVRGIGVGLESPLAYHIALAPSEIAGHRLTEASLHGRSGLRVHHLRGRLLGPVGTADFRAAAVAGAALSYHAAGTVECRKLGELVATLPGSLAARFTLAGRGTEATDRRATLRAAVARGVLRGVPFSGGTVAAELDGETFRLLEARLDGPDLQATASGTGHLRRRTVEIGLTATADLGRVGPRFGQDVAGTAALTARGRGSLDALTVAATAELKTPRYQAVAADQARLAIDLTGLGGTSPEGRARLSASGARFRDRPPRELSADLEWRRTEATDRVSVTASARADTGAADRLVLTASQGAGRITVALQELVWNLSEGPAWHLAGPAAVVIADEVTTPGLLLVAGSQRVEISGRVAIRGSSQATLTTTRLALGPLCALEGGPRCDGELTAHAALTGTAERPALEASLEAQGFRVDDVGYGDVHLTARYADWKATLQGNIQHPQAGELTFDGTVPLELAWAGPGRDVSSEPVDLRLRAEQLDLSVVRVLAPGQVRDAAGRVNVDLAVAGRRAAPQMSGRLALDDGRLALVATGVTYQELRVQGNATGTTLEVNELHARGGDGALDGNGRISLLPGGETSLDLTLHAREFLAVQRPVLETAVSGDIHLLGSLLAPEVNGQLDVERAVMRPTELPGGSATPKSDPSIVVVGAAVEEAPPPRATAGESLRLAVDVRIARNAWVRRTDADIELGGELHVTKAPGEPIHITGVIRLLRGWYTFQGRKFELEEGTITFTGAAPPDPRFDITATFKNPRYRVNVHVGGVASKPTLRLSSDPPLEQADILAVLLFGKPARDLGKGESTALQQQALALAAGYVMPELRTSVMDTLGVDQLEVQMPERTTQPGRVAVGRYVAGDIFVSLAQEFGSRVGQVVGVEYGITHNISIRGSTSTRGGSAVDLFWHRRY
ncbi:MAG TPA: translocation/assembly module TamB domain-containing protein [Candidatus Nitrosopolaris sp.]|nr:translocation/assembly module TamB domain-containing protein [Candidatus Nitrosopolaris sp.]